MKHFRTFIYTANNYSFERDCTSATEAFRAIIDASDTFKLGIDGDELMEILVDLKKGNLISHEGHGWSVRMGNGEV